MPVCDISWRGWGRGDGVRVFVYILCDIGGTGKVYFVHSLVGLHKPATLNLRRKIRHKMYSHTRPASSCSKVWWRLLTLFSYFSFLHRTTDSHEVCYKQWKYLPSEATDFSRPSRCWNCLRTWKQYGSILKDLLLNFALPKDWLWFG